MPFEIALRRVAVRAERKEQFAPIGVLYATVLPFKGVCRTFELFVARVFHGIFHARHDGIGGRTRAEHRYPLLQRLCPLFALCRNDRPLRERGKGLVHAVHPKIGIAPRIQRGHKVQMPPVRAVEDKRLVFPLAERGNRGKIGKIPIVIGRGEQKRVRLCKGRFRLLERGLGGNAELRVLKNGDDPEPERFTGMKDARVGKNGRGDTARSRSFQRPKHGKDPRSAPVRQEKTALCAQNTGNIFLRLFQHARGGEQTVRIAELRNVRARALMPGGVKGNVLFLRAEHFRDVEALFHAPNRSTSARTKEMGS